MEMLCIHARNVESCRGAKLLDGKVLKANASTKELDEWISGLNI